MSFAGIDFRGMTVAEIQRMEASIKFTPMQSHVGTLGPADADRIYAETLRNPPTAGPSAMTAIVGALKSFFVPQGGVAERVADYHRQNGAANNQRREQFRQEYRAQQEINEKYFDSEEAFIDHMIAEEGESNAKPWANFSADPDPSPGQSDEMSFIRPCIATQQAQTQPATSNAGRFSGGHVEMVAADMGDDLTPEHRGYDLPAGKISSDGFGEINFHGVR